LSVIYSHPLLNLDSPPPTLDLNPEQATKAEVASDAAADAEIAGDRDTGSVVEEERNTGGGEEARSEQSDARRRV